METKDKLIKLSEVLAGQRFKNKKDTPVPGIDKDQIPFLRNMYRKSVINGNPFSTDEETAINDIYESYIDIYTVLQFPHELFSKEEYALAAQGQIVSKETKCPACGGQAVYTIYPHTWGTKKGVGIKGGCKTNRCFSMMS